MKTKNSIVIVAGGVGSRMASTIPKQFLMLADKPIIIWSILAFLKYDKNIDIVIVVAPSEEERLQKMLKSEFPNREFKIAHSGKERFFSVKNGLDKCSGELIGIHDAVRPLVSTRCISNCYQAADKNAAAVPVMPVFDSLRKLDGAENSAVDRKDFVVVQTPQVFRAKTLKGAYNIQFTDNLTDDASVVALQGQKITLVEGNRQNIKITTPEDLVIAEAFLKSIN